MFSLLNQFEQYFLKRKFMQKALKFGQKIKLHNPLLKGNWKGNGTVISQSGSSVHFYKDDDPKREQCHALRCEVSVRRVR